MAIHEYSQIAQLGTIARVWEPQYYRTIRWTPLRYKPLFQFCYVKGVQAGRDGRSHKDAGDSESGDPIIKSEMQGTEPVCTYALYEAHDQTVETDRSEWWQGP